MYLMNSITFSESQLECARAKTNYEQSQQQQQQQQHQLFHTATKKMAAAVKLGKLANSPGKSSEAGVAGMGVDASLAILEPKSRFIKLPT